MKTPTNETCVEYPSRIFGQPFALTGNGKSKAFGEGMKSSHQNRSKAWTSFREVLRAIGHHWIATSSARAHGWPD
jgi:hypothetical protein